MIQITAYDTIGTISKQITGYSFWKQMKDIVFTGAENPDKIEEMIINHKTDVVLAVSGLKSFTEVEFIKKIFTNYPYIRLIIISDVEDYTAVRKAFIKGAFDYLISDRLELSLKHAILRMTERQCNEYFLGKIYDKVQLLAKHIFDGGDSVGSIVHSIVDDIYNDWMDNEVTCQQMIEKVKLESYKYFVCRKPWLEKFIYRNDYVKEIGFDIETREETEIRLCRHYEEVNMLFKKYNVIDANKTVYTIGKSIIKQVDSKINLESIANDVYLNKTYVSYIFKKVTGISINEFILEVKIDRAKTLLHYPDLSISEIADILYFCNAGYFTRIFKEHTNITPTQYRDYIKSRK